MLGRHVTARTPLAVHPCLSVLCLYSGRALAALWPDPCWALARLLLCSDRTLAAKIFNDDESCYDIRIFCELRNALQFPDE